MYLPLSSVGSFSSMTAIATNLPEVADRDYKSQLHTHTHYKVEKTMTSQIRGSEGDESPLNRGKEKKEAARMLYSFITQTLS